MRSGISQPIAMAISGQKALSVFHQYDIVSSEDLQRAAEPQAEYLKSQSKHRISTISAIEHTNALQHRANLLILLMGRA